MPFLTPAVMTTHPDNKWRMVEELDYQFGQRIIRIPKGFVHDMASIPRPFNLFIRKHGNHTEAAILHDWLYANTGLINSFSRLTRLQCDHLFYRAMIESGVSQTKACLMFRAVRLGGWASWDD